MSNEKFEFAEEERAEALQLIDQLREAIADSLFFIFCQME